MKKIMSLGMLLGLAAATAQGQMAATAVIYDPAPATGIGTTPPAGAYTSPLQTIDAVATGSGAVGTAALESLPGLFINTFWEDATTRFAMVGESGNLSRNYLAFTTPNANGVKTAVKFDFNAGGIGDQFTGGFNSTGPRIVVAAGQSIFLGASLVTAEGQMEITLGSYTGSGTTESGITFMTGPSENAAYAARAIGFIISGAAAGSTTVVELYGVKGQLLSTLESTSPGETAGGENAAGGELFFGYDAGAEPANWVHRIVIDGDTGGNAGLDDFAFTPVAVVEAGPPTPTAVIYDTPSAAGIGVTQPVAPYTAPLQTIDVTATGTGAVNAAALESLSGLFINTFWEDSAGTRFARVGADGDKSRNYLAFTTPNANGVKTAVKFDFNDGGLSDEFAGGFNDNGPRIVVAGGQSVFLGAALAEESGLYEITFGGYEGSGSTEADITFLPTSGTLAHAVRAAGFIVSGAAAGTTTTASYYGIKGQLLGTLEATSTGETAAGENTAGGELFFGYDAGEEQGNWIHRIVIDGDTGGNAGFDDFAFTPVAAVNTIGSIFAGFTVVEGYILVPRMGWVYIVEAPWLYVADRDVWIYATEDLFGEGGAYFYGKR